MIKLCCLHIDNFVFIYLFCFYYLILLLFDFLVRKFFVFFQRDISNKDKITYGQERYWFIVEILKKYRKYLNIIK